MEATALDLPALILIRSPEITLKGRNQGEFWLRLRANLGRHLAHRGIAWPIRTARARLFVEAGRDPRREDVERALEAVSEVAGVESFSLAFRLERRRFLEDGKLDRGLVEDVLVSMAGSDYQPDRCFAVRAHRIDKSFPLTSAELESWLGQRIRERTAWSRVRLERPDRTFYLDVYRDAMFFYSERHRGVGGLPVGTSGQILSLLSGGIDSPVASFLLARRGAAVDWFHMSAAPTTERDFESSVVGRIARKLSRTTLRSRLFIVPYTHFDLALSGRETGYEAVLFRRFLFRAAETLARRIGAIALSTGDSLAQVSSQTLPNLVATTGAVEMLVLPPLVGMDKQQIVEIARRIGTYDIAIEPHKDCCALYARRARTRARIEAVSALEARILPDLPGLVERTLAKTTWGEYESGDLVSVRTTLEAAQSLSS